MDVTYLNQAGNIIILSDTDTQERASSQWDSDEDSCLGIESSDLSEYLRDCAEIDALNAAYLVTDPSTNDTGSSFASTSAPSSTVRID